MRKVIVTIMIFILMILSFMKIGENVQAADEVIVTHKDWSEIKNIDREASYSTVFYSKDTTATVVYQNEKVKKNNGPKINNKNLEEVTVEPGGEAVIQITKCAINENGEFLDVVVKIKNVVGYTDLDATDENGKPITVDPEVRFDFGGIKLSKKQEKDPTEMEKQGYETRDIAVGELINMGLHAKRASCSFIMKYYKSGTYSLETKNATKNEPYTEEGTEANITKMNTFFYDVDYGLNTEAGERFKNEFLQGCEGVQFTRGSSTIYYDKSKETGCIEAKDEGIAAKRHEQVDQADIVNVNSVWYRTSAFIETEKLKNSVFSFKYGGIAAGMYYSFMSPFPYEIGDIKKSVSTEKQKSDLDIKNSSHGEQRVVKENEKFTYTISQYIPNNYYGSLINFSEIYKGVYGDTHFKSIQISDKLDDNLEICGNIGDIKIKNEQGEDKTELFKITFDEANNQVTAKVKENSALPNPELYSHIYNINIPVKIKPKTGEKIKDEKSVPNQASCTFEIRRCHTRKKI